MSTQQTDPAQAGRIILQKRVAANEAVEAVDFIARHTGLSKGAVKAAMTGGAAWLTRGRSGRKRLRRAKSPLRAGDLIECFYDPELLQRPCPEARLVADLGRYSVWFKPAGMLTQGNQFGDFCALERFAEKALAPQRKVWLVHRLDRETPGLLLLGHDRGAAAALSALFRDGRVEKRYRAEVVGDVAANLAPEGVFDAPIGRHPARTEYRVVAHDAGRGVSLLDVRIATGRTHQIRRHLAEAGFPLLGDPRYGSGNKNRDGMRLAAWRLAFRCPLSGEPREFELDPESLFTAGDAD